MEVNPKRPEAARKQLKNYKCGTYIIYFNILEEGKSGPTREQSNKEETASGKFVDKMYAKRRDKRAEKMHARSGKSGPVPPGVHSIWPLGCRGEKKAG